MYSRYFLLWILKKLSAIIRLSIKQSIYLFGCLFFRSVCICLSTYLLIYSIVKVDDANFWHAPSIEYLGRGTGMFWATYRFPTHVLEKNMVFIQFSCICDYTCNGLGVRFFLKEHDFGIRHLLRSMCQGKGNRGGKGGRRKEKTKRKGKGEKKKEKRKRRKGKGERDRVRERKKERRKEEGKEKEKGERETFIFLESITVACAIC